MTPPPASGRPSQPVRIEVQTTKVDATLDLVAILQKIAGNAEQAERGMPRGVAGPSAAAMPADAAEQLTAIGQLARDLATKLATVGSDAPQLRDAIERASTQAQQ